MKVRGRDEGTEWASLLGLDVSSKQGWKVVIHLETTGDLPDTTYYAMKTSRFTLSVSEGGYWVGVTRAKPSDMRGRTFHGKEFSYGKHQGQRGIIGYKTLALDPPTKLATILDWLTNVEKKTKLVFRRDRPGITSNVKGGAKAAAAWLIK